MWLPTDPFFDLMQRRWNIDGPDGFTRPNPIAQWFQRFSLRHRIIGAVLRSGLGTASLVLGMYLLISLPRGSSVAHLWTGSTGIFFLVVFIGGSLYFAAYDSWHLRRFGPLDD